jgi:hypothetical protein
LGFVEAKSNNFLFFFRCGTYVVYLLLYLDGIVITASSVTLLQQTISALKWEFTMKDLRPLHHFLGVSVQHQADRLFLTRCQFALNILERAGTVDCKLVSMPVDTQTKVSVESELQEPRRGPPVPNIHPHRHRIHRPTDLPSHA